MNILITGARGFTARHLIPLLSKDKNLRLFLTGQGSSDLPNYLPGDLTQPAFARKILEKARPVQVYHLAASFAQDYSTAYSVNVQATQHLLQGLLDLKLSCRVLLVGSAAEYGEVSPEDNPIRETQPLKPAGLYGLTKIYQTHLMQFYRNVYQMDLVMARTFNLSGKGMPERLFVGKMEKQIENLKKGSASKIKTGPLKTERDYIPVEEASRLYQALMEKGKAGEVYNVGSGKPTKMSDLLKALLTESGLSMDVVEESLAPDGRIDVPRIYADISKLKNLTGTP